MTKSNPFTIKSNKSIKTKHNIGKHVSTGMKKKKQKIKMDNDMSTPSTKTQLYPDCKFDHGVIHKTKIKTKKKGKKIKVDNNVERTTSTAIKTFHPTYPNKTMPNTTTRTQLKNKISKDSSSKKPEVKTNDTVDDDNDDDDDEEEGTTTQQHIRTRDILDPHYDFDADIIRKATNMGCSKLLSHARNTILELLKARDYRACLALLTAMIETCKFKTLAYWKVGEEIIRNCRPEDLSLFLASVVSGIRAPKNLPAWKEQLLYTLNEEGYTAFINKLQGSIEKHDDSQSITKLVALVMHETWERMIKNQHTGGNNTLPLLFDTEEQLCKSYQLNPSDRYIVKAYLQVLSTISKISDDGLLSRSQQEQQQQSIVKIKQVVDTALQNEINDPELISILLYYGSQGLDEDMDLGITLCSEDPVADARIKFLPIIKSMKSVSKLDPSYHSTLMTRAGLIVERLEHGVTDTWTLDELDVLLDDLEFVPYHIRFNMVSFFTSIDLQMTLNGLQLGVNDDDIIALDTLEFLKFKVVDMTLCPRQDIPSSTF